MQQYQIDSLLRQIAFHTATLALPLTDIDCVLLPDSRKALFFDISANIDYLYVHSHIDSYVYSEISDLASNAYTQGAF